MGGMRRALPVAVALLAAAPASARGDGLPFGNVDAGRQGVVAPGSEDRIVTLRAGRGATLVARVERDGGRVLGSFRVREPLTVPGIALDGTADGRSADGETAVLIRPRRGNAFPQRRTRLAILDVRPLRVRRWVTLRGDFSFDALSPDGRRMYLVHYVDPRDPRAYVVRSFDVRSGRMEPGAIVDAREPAEDMRGYPVTRATTSDGRWAYTLYEGGGEPFVHALDTAERRAFCIDLPMLARRDDVYEMRLRLGGGGGLSVRAAGETVAVVDTATMTAAAPPPERPSRPAPPPPEEGSAGPDWWLAGVLAAFGVVAIAGTRALRRSRAAR
jgi:hypothetical protein